MLTFWGRGSAFRAENNSAFFVDGNNLILLDFPMSSLHKLIQADPFRSGDPFSAIKQVYVLVTHTHSDHIGGIPMLIHYAYYVRGKLPVTVVAPSLEVAEDLRFFIDRLEGCEAEAYEIITADQLSSWISHVIPTTHTPQLAGRCFGYHLTVNGKNVIYTGDTNTLEPFTPYLTKGSYLYTEVACGKSPVHLSLEDSLEELNKLAAKGIYVYLMHLDEEEKILKAIQGTQLLPAPLYPMPAGKQ